MPIFAPILLHKKLCHALKHLLPGCLGGGDSLSFVYPGEFSAQAGEGKRLVLFNQKERDHEIDLRKYGQIRASSSKLKALNCLRTIIEMCIVTFQGIFLYFTRW